MKLVLECILAMVLHPIAVVLAWIDIARRSDLSTSKKMMWVVVTLFWGIGPILYVVVGDGKLWR